MCYLKNLVREQENFDFDQFMGKPDEPSKDETPEEQNILMPCPQKHFSPCWSDDQQKLINLFSLIEKNNMMISSLTKTLEKNSQKYQKSSIQTEEQSPFYTAEDRSFKRISDEESKVSMGSQDLITKLFGNHKYKYRIQAKQKFPQVIYKERNFNIQLLLVNHNGQVVKNCNFLNLCLAVSNQEGEWVLQNRVGEPFMKGKTEVQLIKGQSQFRKIYARDVSRGYPGGKLNIIVYCKPSTLLSNPASFETFISHEEIKPLLIQNIVIKAKKKE